MRKLALLLLIYVFAFNACDKPDIAKGTPPCVKSKIKDFETNSSTCPDGANVKEYKFQGKTTYVFDPGICGADMASEVIDADCKTLGWLGGIAGISKINNEDFSNANFKKIIWKR